MTYVFPPAPQPVIPVHRSAPGDVTDFPVHRIYCVGRNYADHAREMGADPDREPPFFFTKPADAVALAGLADEPQIVPFPPRTQDLHHEIELVVGLLSGGSNLTEQQARDSVFGFAVGLDLTRRDLQQQAKDHGRPWDTAKGFDASAPIGQMASLQTTGWPQRGRIWLKVNGELRQQGDIADMIWNIGEIIAELSTLFELRAGDLIFTGTPAGVGRVQPGDLLEGGVEGIGELAVRIQ